MDAHDFKELHWLLDIIQSTNIGIVVLDRELRVGLRRLLAGLTPKEEYILRARFGIDHDQEITLEEAGDRMGVTRERVRQIQARALLRLRDAGSARGIEVYARD